MSGPLAGRTVVVTRPAHQSAGLVAELRHLGAQVVEFPAIRIEPVPPETADAQTDTDEFDWVIYTSANAVAVARTRLAKPLKAQVAAIGPATARALELAGIPIAAQPQLGADSEGMLALPVFASLDGARVLIVRGVGGRDLLRRELTRRGALVQVAQLYRRVSVTPTPTAIYELAAALAPGTAAITVSSGDVLRSLARIVPAALAASLRAATLVVPGQRGAEAARKLGWTGELIEATGAEDAAMVQALVEHARSRGPRGGA